MIGHERIAKCIEHQETKKRTERRDKERHRHFGAATDNPSGKEDYRGYSNESGQPSVSKRIARIDVPPRITKRQVRRPDQFAGIKPNGVTGDRQSLSESDGKLRSLGTLMMTF